MTVLTDSHSAMIILKNTLALSVASYAGLLLECQFPMCNRHSYPNNIRPNEKSLPLPEALNLHHSSSSWHEV